MDHDQIEAEIMQLWETIRVMRTDIAAVMDQLREHDYRIDHVEEEVRDVGLGVDELKDASHG